MEYVKSCMQQRGSVESFLSKRLETICTEITIKTPSKKNPKNYYIKMFTYRTRTNIYQKPLMKFNRLIQIKMAIIIIILSILLGT